MLADDLGLWDFSDDVYNALRAADDAAEGAALQASARAALLHWAALALLGASLLLSLAMELLPGLRPWSAQAIWVLVLGVLAYLAVVGIVYFSSPTPPAPELSKVRRIRHGIAALLAERQAARGARRDPVLIQALTDAIRHLDEHVIPALHQLIERRSSLERELGRYVRRELHAPAPEVLERLQRLNARLQVAIDECVQQAANAYAMLVALLQEGDDEDVAARARSWADDLARLYDSLAEVLHGTDEPARATDGPARPTDGPADTPVPPSTASTDAEGATARAHAASTGQPDRSVDELVPLVEEALRCVRDRSALVGRDLIAYLPYTVAEILREQRNGHASEATGLEQAGALQQVLIAGVQRLRPGDEIPDGGGSEQVRLRVLHDQYVEGRPPRQIMMRYHIAEATYHRYRRRAIRILTQELIEREALLARRQRDAATD
jgi:hypothetical protein